MVLPRRKRPRRQWDASQVRALRRHLGYSQQQLAQELGVRQQTISEWESGVYRPRGASQTLLNWIAERAGFPYGGNPSDPRGGAMEVPYRDLLLVLVQGDITEVEAEALVNAANNQGWMGGGVAGALRRKGGPEIEREAVHKGPWPVGEAIVTGAGRLKAKYVIHAATMAMDFQTDATKIRQATRNSLLRAQELGLSSVAFPALGAGVGRFPLREVARIMLEEVRDHASRPTTLKKVIFVMYEEEAYRAFEQELRKLQRDD